jgi:hypothetical protein
VRACARECVRACTHKRTNTLYFYLLKSNAFLPPLWCFIFADCTENKEQSWNLFESSVEFVETVKFFDLWRFR